MQKEKETAMTVHQAIGFVEQAYGEKYHFNTFYRWLTNGKLKGFRRGGQWRINKSDLHDFFCPENQNKPRLVGVS